jgi:hypothetical protein
MRNARLLLLVIPLLSLAAAAAPPRLPALVFVSRNGPGAGMAGVPGVGPRDRTLASGGSLLVRESNGRFRVLLPAGTLFDASDPCVSWDGKRIVFAGAAARDSAWRIYVVGADGRGLRAITRTDRALDLAPLGGDPGVFERYDDFDPCWLPDGRVCFASTRFPQIAEAGGRVASNLFTVNADGTDLRRLTTERNGGEEPAVDPATGRILYTRWWFNRYLASESETSGITTDRTCAVPSDTVDLWITVSAMTDGDGVRLAGGDPRGRASMAAYQPAMLTDGTLVGVRGERLALSPDGGRLTVQIFPRGFAAPVPLAGGGVNGVSACAPAFLPDGRVVLSLDRAGSGDFGLYAVRQDGSGLERILDFPGTLELDAAPLVAHRRPPVLAPQLVSPMPDLPVTSVARLHDLTNTFRFDCLNVFANAGIDQPFPAAPPMQQGVRIRFYAALARPGSALGDSVVLVRESPVSPYGAVHQEDMPSDVPMFEQLVDDRGRVLRSASGPAHVPGFNAGRFGTGTKCVGCHAGHSALPVPESHGLGKWLNASPSAEVTATGAAPGTAGPAAIADRRTLGPPAEVAWVGLSADETLRLQWKWPIEVNALVVYALRPGSAPGTDLRIHQCEFRFFRNGQETGSKVMRAALSPGGTRVECDGVRVDAIEIHPLRVTGRVMNRPVVGIAEVETIARMAD